MDYRDKIIAYDRANYMDRLLPKETYKEVVSKMKEKHLMAITCPSCGKRTANTSNKCWICNAPLEVEVQVQVELYKCPKSNKCVMDCYHKLPHEPDKYCNVDFECPNCVRELAADITFFPEDFEIE